MSSRIGNSVVRLENGRYVVGFTTLSDQFGTYAEIFEVTAEGHLSSTMRVANVSFFGDGSYRALPYESVYGETRECPLGNYTPAPTLTPTSAPTPMPLPTVPAPTVPAPTVPAPTAPAPTVPPTSWPAPTRRPRARPAPTAAAGARAAGRVAPCGVPMTGRAPRRRAAATGSRLGSGGWHVAGSADGKAARAVARAVGRAEETLVRVLIRRAVAGIDAIHHDRGLVADPRRIPGRQSIAGVRTFRGCRPPVATKSRLSCSTDFRSGSERDRYLWRHIVTRRRHSRYWHQQRRTATGTPVIACRSSSRP